MIEYTEEQTRAHAEFEAATLRRIRCGEVWAQLSWGIDWAARTITTELPFWEDPYLGQFFDCSMGRFFVEGRWWDAPYIVHRRSKHTDDPLKFHPLVRSYQDGPHYQSSRFKGVQLYLMEEGVRLAGVAQRGLVEFTFRNAPSPATTEQLRAAEEAYEAAVQEEERYRLAAAHVFMVTRDHHRLTRFTEGKHRGRLYTEILVEDRDYLELAVEGLSRDRAERPLIQGLLLAHPRPPGDKGFAISFGRHKGLTFHEIREKDAPYLAWMLAERTLNRQLRQKLQDYLAVHPLSPEEQKRKPV